MPEPVPPPQPMRAPRTRSCDPFAAALGNASLLGVGYLLLRRRGLAVLAVAGTVALGFMLASAGRNPWFQGVAPLWWVAVTAHGWYLAGGWPRRTGPKPEHPPPGTGPRDAPPPPARRQRLIAAAVAVPALLCVTALRLDAGRIERNASEAHRDGDCSRVLSILDGLWTGHRVVNAPLIVRAEAQTAACRLLLQALRQAQADRPLAVMTLRRYAAHPGALWQGADGRRAELLLAEAADEFDTALTGDITALSTGYTLLSDVLKEFPDREEEAGKVVDELLDRLPVKDACDNRNIVDWLGDRPRRGDVLDRARSTASALVPAALIKCADDLADDERWPEARIWYKMLVDDYPGHELAATARRGIRKADLAIQLETVTKRLEPGSSGKPEYCTNPARYEGAPRYRGRGPHRALIFGQNGHRKRLPSSWLASGAKNAVLVICAGRSTYGTRVATCPYITSANNVYNVSFYRRRIPVRVYELRTGKLVRKTSLQIGGRACPGRIRYTTYVGDAPPSKWYVTSSRWDIRAAYGRLINP